MLVLVDESNVVSSARTWLASDRLKLRGLSSMDEKKTRQSDRINPLPLIATPPQCREWQNGAGQEGQIVHRLRSNGIPRGHEDGITNRREPRTAHIDAMMAIDVVELSVEMRPERGQSP